MWCRPAKAEGTKNNQPTYKIFSMTEVNRGKPPEPLAPVPFNVPEAFRTTLPSGLRLVVLKDDRLPLVSYRLGFMSGDINDPPDNVGLSSAVAAMLTEG